MRYIFLFFTCVIVASCNSIKKTANNNFNNQSQHYIFNDKISAIKKGKKVYIDNFSILYIPDYIPDSTIKTPPIAIKDLRYTIYIEDTMHKNIAYTILTSGVQLDIHQPILKGLINMNITQTSTIEGFAQNKYDTADKINFYLRNYDNRSEPQPSSEIIGNSFRMLIEPIVYKKFSFLASNSTKTKLEGYKIGYAHAPVCFIDITNGEIWISSFNIHDNIKTFLLGLSTIIFLKN